MLQYILTPAGEPIAEPDPLKWGQWMQSGDRVVIKTQIGDAEVSTVFLGLDHAFDGGTPILWETMVFGGPMDQECNRCAGSREQAEAMHARMVERVVSKL